MQQMMMYDPRFSGGLTSAGGLKGITNVEGVAGKALGTATGAIEDYAATENSKAVVANHRVAMDDMGTYIHEFTTELRNRYKDKNEVGYKTLLKGMFDWSHSGISGEAIANGDIEELNKLNSMSNETKKKIYSFITKQMDPSGTSPWAIISASKMSDYYLDKSQTKVQVERSLRDFETVVEGVRDESTVTSNLLQSYYKTREVDESHWYDLSDTEKQDAQSRTSLYREQNNLKADLVKFYIENSSSGLFPTPKEQVQLSKKWAKIQQEKGVDPAVFDYWDEDSLIRLTDPKYEQRTPEQFAEDASEELQDNFYKLYSEKSKAWNANPMLGGLGSSGEVGGAFTVPFDLRYGPEFENNRAVGQVFNDWLSSPEQHAQFTNALEKSDSETNVAAQNLLKVYHEYLTAPRTTKDKNVPSGEIMYQGVAFGDRDWTAATITLPMSFLQEYANKMGIPGKEKESWINARHKPITFAIPKSTSTNVFAQESAISVNDYRLANGKPITIDYHPGAGSATIMASDLNGYNLDFDLTFIDEEGEEFNESWSAYKPRTTNLNGDVMEMLLAEQLGLIERANVIAKKNNAKNNGYKGTSEEVIQQIRNFIAQINGRQQQ